MPTSFRPYVPEQAFLLPPSLKEWLPSGHLAHFVSDMVDQLDLGPFYARYAGDGRRRQPFDPLMMVKVLVYAYASGVFSSRKIATRMQEDIAFRMLGANNAPAHRTIREFRQLHITEFSALFVQVVRLAKETGLVKLGRLGVDGTKVRASASKHKAMGYGRMREEEIRLKHEIGELLKQAEVADVAEDLEHGPDLAGNELPEELRRRESRLKVIAAAKARLEQRQREEDQEIGRKPDDEHRPPSGRGPDYQRDFGVPHDQAQENFTDPQSRIMKTQDGFQQCYNAQAAVDEGSLLIVANDLGNNASDQGQLIPMLEKTESNLNARPAMTLADAGYASEETLRELEKRGLPACVALGREGKSDRMVNAAKYPAKARMAEQLKTPEGEAHYRRRKVIPEPVFGWIKQALGFRRFSMRGLKKVKGEWDLICLAVNLKRIATLLTFAWAPA
jgi:transposase